LAPGYGDGLAVFRAAINLKLMAVGKPTIRQDFSLQVKRADGCQSPSRPLTAVVVDDDPLEICRTLRALAGWPSLTVVPFLFSPDLVPGSADDRSLAGQLLTVAAGAILELKPDIVIMDEGMPVVDGGQLIRAIRELNPEHEIEFVGSTGGMGEGLRAAGAILNLKKGAYLEPLEQAIRRLPAR
jgi:CheY-like chemotaxis protein